jgi:hypothetical protein
MPFTEESMTQETVNLDRIVENESGEEEDTEDDEGRYLVSFARD